MYSEYAAILLGFRLNLGLIGTVNLHKILINGLKIDLSAS